MLRAARAGAVAALAAALTLSSCGEPPSDDATDAAQPDGASIRFRLWDEAAASAYQESFDAFNAIHRDIHVEVEVVPARSYASRAVSDLSTGTMADVFWVPSDAAGDWISTSDLVEPPVGEDWEPSVADLFTLDGHLWAVPQLWETSALFVNSELLEPAGVAATDLTWDPAAPQAEAALRAREEAEAQSAEAAADSSAEDEDSGAQEDTDTAAAGDDDGSGPDGPPTDVADEPADEPAEEPLSHEDTLREAVRLLTRDAEGRDATDPDFDAEAVTEYGYNPDLTAPPVWLTFLAQGTEPGEPVVLGDDTSLTEAFTYLSELPVVVAPPEGAVSDRELFAEGRLALFQSTSADLRYLAEHTRGQWEVAPVPAGPAGTVSVVSGIGAAANVHSPHADATAQVLEWVASADGQSALASHSVGIPAALGAQELFTRAWAERGLQTAALLDPAAVVTISSGAATLQTLDELTSVLARLFAGELTVEEALSVTRRTIEAVQ